ncbi:hypothetical protein BDN70DRAFT_916965 [Pholiota conissans]|uniref:Uncharacterized protein n=1 Tax=Pholiota conissans TaxID=109636 RepID=A0A9P5ZDS7_9AGAR|nr:hypothetical protein BDN70DRAFT_916965 [Pholiota conissans]
MLPAQQNVVPQHVVPHNAPNPVQTIIVWTSEQFKLNTKLALASEAAECDEKYILSRIRAKHLKAIAEEKVALAIIHEIRARRLAGLPISNTQVALDLAKAAHDVLEAEHELARLYVEECQEKLAASKRAESAALERARQAAFNYDNFHATYFLRRGILARPAPNLVGNLYHLRVSLIIYGIVSNSVPHIFLHPTNTERATYVQRGLHHLGEIRDGLGGYCDGLVESGIPLRWKHDNASQLPKRSSVPFSKTLLLF